MPVAERIIINFNEWMASNRCCIKDGKVVLKLRAIGHPPSSIEYSAYAPDCNPLPVSLDGEVSVTAWTRKGIRRKARSIVEQVREYYNQMKLAYRIPDSRLELRVEF